MKKIVLSLILSFFIFSSNAHAFLPIGIYYGIKGGMTSQSEKLKINSNGKSKNDKTNYFGSAEVGVRLLKFRFELEYTLRPNTTKLSLISKNKDILSQNIMGNVYYNFLEIPFFKFYVNGGIGNTRFSGSSEIKNKNNSTWVAGFGVNFSLLNITNIDVGYRYMDMGKLKFNSGLQNRKVAQDIYAGIRFGF